MAVLDTGLRITHQDLKDNVWINTVEAANPSDGIDNDGNGYPDDVYGMNFVPTTPTPTITDDNDHGTAVSGALGAVANGIGGVGVAWDVKIMTIKVANHLGAAPAETIHQGVQYAIANGVQVLNMSLGDDGSGSTSAQRQTLNEAVQDAANAGMLIVGITHNGGSNIDVAPNWPAFFDHDNFISVTGSDENDNPAYNYGLVKADLAAPSVNIYTPGNSSDTAYVTGNGTSLGAPITAGVVAILRAQYPRESYLNIINRLLSSVDVKSSLNGKCSTGGRLNMDAALSQATAAPPNNHFARRFKIAIPSGATSMTATGNNVEANKESGEPNHAGNGGGASVWWEWTPGINGTVSVKTKGSGINTLLNVYTGTAVGSLTSVASEAISDGYSWAKVTFTANASTAYKIAVDGYYGAVGTVRLTVETGTAVREILKFLTSTISRPSGQFSVQLSGPASASVEVTYSTDLITWSSHSTVSLNGSGLYTFTDTGASAGHRYYRAKTSTGVESANSVGYVDLTIPAGHSYICNPLTRSVQTLATLIPTATDGDTVYRYNSQTGGYEASDYDAVFGGWNDPSWVFPPGVGFDYYAIGSGSRSFTFIGEVAARFVTRLPANWALVGSALPVTRVINSLGFPIESGDTVYLQTGSLVTSHSYWNGIWEPNQPVIGVGQSFFIRRVADWRQNAFVWP